MGLLNEIIGAVVAEEVLQRADPSAGLLKEGMAALAGFEAEKFAQNKLQERTSAETDSSAPDDPPA